MKPVEEAKTHFH